MKRVLVLAGSSEARELIAAISSRFDVVASLAGATRAPLELGCETRVGGFGGVSGLVDYLRDARIDILVDATHPFAAQMTDHGAQAASLAGIAHVVLQREGWVPTAGDNWVFVDRFEEVAQIIPKGCTVFLGTGRQTLGDFANMVNRRLLCRVIDPPQGPFPYDSGRFVVGRPPFSIAEEVAFFQSESVEWLVVKNAGGTRSRSKLDAARQLGLPVVMQRRPALPDVPVVDRVSACVAWLEGQT
ncbi:cobalt-precorrin-6A reductase [Roseobacter sp. N2S]|uniref:cobalt-precorrin-6A reductase n=1 Tax=Roseobacter sp. N2S TaxID=2663844 RepID=UPI002857E0EF|nr:cobalt-precorrin-6A reductase [Roseobacter sp. N2S]MDR6266216.1 precorrin-6A/cobalt-precorrin-6A reductase [Roseobacter sp. N2S]